MSICPYCNQKLEKIPTRKKKCPNCGNFIFVKSKPNQPGKFLVTEKEKEKIDKEWKKEALKNKWLRNLSNYGITKQDFENQKNFIRENYNKAPRDIDILWSMFNKFTTQTIDPHELKMIYREMALFLNDENRDFIRVLQMSKKMELLNIKNEGVKKVVIKNVGNDSCIECKKIHDQIIDIDYALQYMPIPIIDCTTKIDNGVKGFCRCNYYAYDTYEKLKRRGILE